MAFKTFGELRQELARENIAWTVNPALADDTVIERPSLGLLNKPPPADETKRVDVAALVNAAPPRNTLLAQELYARGVLKTAPRFLGRTGALPHPPAGAGGGGTPPLVVDWRNRYGWPWITTIRDQDPCEHCWIYSATALIESMVRIEHCVWSPRSEGDYIEANKTPCGACGDPASVLNWVAANGMTDQDCVPWVDSDPGNRTAAYWNPAPSSCGTGSMLPPPAYAPASNRDGRTTKIPAYTSINNIQDQKNWVQNIGPIICFFEVWSDFQGWSGTTPYEKVSTATDLGSHVMLVVGFDDGQGCWIVKNSWGQYLGNAGYWLIKYGQCNIDSSAKLGLRFTNPDPWVKRRNHNGGMIESGDGALHDNFELIAPGAGKSFIHWWRDNSNPALPWAKAETIGNDVADPPTFTATTYNRNFEMVYRTTAGRLHHRWFNQQAHTWNDGPIFGPNGTTGAVGFTESGWGPGNFEVVVAVGGQLHHWWRNSAGAWAESAIFGANILTAGASLLQSTYGTLCLVAVLTSGAMQHFWRNGSNWQGDPAFGAGISSPPVMIQGEYGMANEKGNGNFELVVANESGEIEHWWRNNQSPSFPWAKSATFGGNISRVVCLLEGSFGFDLELVAIHNDGMLQHFWRDGGGWHDGVLIGSTE